jgi:AAA ATPase domain
VQPRRRHAAPALVGRDAELTTLVARAAVGKTGRGLILSGLRGVGKIVLLNVMADRAERAGWIVARLEAHATVTGQAPFELQLARTLRTSVRKSDSAINSVTASRRRCRPSNRSRSRSAALARPVS